MILYMDTSVLIKLYINEEGSQAVRDIVQSADLIATSKVAYAETMAVFSRLRKENNIKEDEYHLLKNSFKKDWKSFIAVELSDEVIDLCDELTEKYALRGFDAIHLASAIALKTRLKQKVIGGCWDARLWDAFRDNMDVFPASRPGSF